MGICWLCTTVSEKLYTRFYESTAGEIEARDVSARKDHISDAIKENRPDIDWADVVFSDSSTFGKLTYKGKAKSSKSSQSGYKAKIRMLANGTIFELVEEATYNKTAATSVASPASSKVLHQGDVAAVTDMISEDQPGVKQHSSTDSDEETSAKIPVATSFRVALVDALEGLARRDEEKRLLNTYRTYIKNAQAVQERLVKTRKEIAKQHPIDACRQKRTSTFLWRFVFALSGFPGRPSIVAPREHAGGHVPGA